MDNQTREALIILQEECSEVTQVAAKCFRFGMDGEYDGETNRVRLQQELGDILAMIDILEQHGVISAQALAEAKLRKFKKLERWSTLVVPQ